MLARAIPGFVASTMRLLFDSMIFLGALLLAFGTDLVIATSGEPSTLGGPLGVIASLLGTALLTAGILNHCRMTREQRGIENRPSPSDKAR
jgi:hypothetical protein